jgi:hypothetical protein
MYILHRVDKINTIMCHINSHDKGGYIVGNQILDGIIVSHEPIHSPKSTKKSSMFIKLDMEKAYDCFNWNFFFQILATFRLSLTWIKWVKNLVSSTFFYVLVNGSLTPLFNPSHGIYQIDHISLFLFIHLAEELGRCLIHIVML